MEAALRVEVLSDRATAVNPLQILFSPIKMIARHYSAFALLTRHVHPNVS